MCSEGGRGGQRGVRVETALKSSMFSRVAAFNQRPPIFLNEWNKKKQIEIGDMKINVLNEFI